MEQLGVIGVMRIDMIITSLIFMKQLGVIGVMRIDMIIMTRERFLSF
jgi:hypothetical protein